MSESSTIDVSSWVCTFERSAVVLDPLRKHHTVPEQAKLLLETENQLGLQLIRPRPPLSEQLPTLLQYNLGLDEMFFVNLDREPVRRDWTIRVALNEGFHLKRVSAVDGKYVTFFLFDEQSKSKRKRNLVLIKPQAAAALNVADVPIVQLWNCEGMATFPHRN